MCNHRTPNDPFLRSFLYIISSFTPIKSFVYNKSSSCSKTTSLEYEKINKNWQKQPTFGLAEAPAVSLRTIFWSTGRLCATQSVWIWTQVGHMAFYVTKLVCTIKPKHNLTMVKLKFDYEFVVWNVDINCTWIMVFAFLVFCVRVVQNLHFSHKLPSYYYLGILPRVLYSYTVSLLSLPFEQFVNIGCTHYG